MWILMKSAIHVKLIYETFLVLGEGGEGNLKVRRDLLIYQIMGKECN